jgi:hypothetical protein
VLSLFLGQVETVVNEAPAEVFDVELAVTIVIHGFKDAGNPFDTAGRAVKNLCLDVSNEVVDGERFELLHGDSVGCIRGITDKPDVLVVLELRRDVGSKVAVVFQSQVLGTAESRERVAHDLLLATEVVSVTLLVTGQVVAGAAVAEVKRFVAHDRLALTLHAEVGIRGVDDPHRGECLPTVHRSLIETRDG